VVKNLAYLEKLNEWVMREHKNNKRPRNIYFGKQYIRPFNNKTPNNPISSEISKEERLHRLLTKFHKPKATSTPDKS
jgi:hypothetical protein